MGHHPRRLSAVTLLACLAVFLPAPAAVAARAVTAAGPPVRSPSDRAATTAPDDPGTATGLPEYSVPPHAGSRPPGPDDASHRPERPGDGGGAGDEGEVSGSPSEPSDSASRPGPGTSTPSGQGDGTGSSSPARQEPQGPPGGDASATRQPSSPGTGTDAPGVHLPVRPGRTHARDSARPALTHSSGSSRAQLPAPASSSGPAAPAAPALGARNRYEADRPATGPPTGAAGASAEEVSPVFPLGAGFTSMGLGLAFLALRLRRD